ncbi:Alpha/Beta hydrolase protein [Phaeosphaeriaceae sp. PMI808]|nr:Alpha/Beta hydrolase protein [Phaeosphaeriaceae sp. PMI808]
MALQYFLSKLSILPTLFSYTTTSQLTSIPLSHRLRLLILQPLTLLAAALTAPIWLFKNNYTVIYIPTRTTTSRRCLLFKPPSQRKSSTPLAPLHIDIHGGAFIGGFPEQGARFCTELCERTGVVVLSLEYRHAPRHIYPAAHDDVDDIVRWAISHAAELGCDARLLTIGGSSVGAGLGLSTCRTLASEGVRVRGALAVYPALTFRVRPGDKVKPEGFPRDPLSFLAPLYDVYAGAERARNWGDARLHTLLAERESLPEDVLVIAAGIDVLYAEAVEFKERMGNVEMMVVENGFHGFLELPSFILEKERREAFDRAVSFVSEVHRKAEFDRK